MTDKDNFFRGLLCGTIEYGILVETGLENERKTELLKKADELIAKAEELKQEAEKI